MSANHRCCGLCGEWGWFDGSSLVVQHKCKPAWECRGAWEDYPNAPRGKARALASEAAAEKYAEDDDCDGGDYAILGSRVREPTIIYVRKPIDPDLIGPSFAEGFSIKSEAVASLASLSALSGNPTMAKCGSRGATRT